jgi:chloramphenicol-sensitive protein RarD
MQLAPHDERRGLFFGLAAYGLWGLMPLYFKLVIDRVNPLELVGFRVGWSFLFLCVVVTAVGGWQRVASALGQKRVMLVLAASTVMIGANWISYVYAVYYKQILQASLGYFITPLVNVALGVILLRERLHLLQLAGILLAAVGVINLAVEGGAIPYLALAIAFSFGLYGLLRKLVPVDGATSLLIETAIMGPVAIGLLLNLRSQTTAGPIDGETHLLLALSGIVTALPLLCFGAAARRLSLTTLGILQYIAPTVQFLFAVLLFGEAFPAYKLVSFVCIWIAVAIYTYGSLHGRRNAGEVPQVEPVPEEVIETA